MTPIRTKSDKPSSNPVNRIRQSGKRDELFAIRFSEALANRDRAWLSRETGLSASTLHDYSRGAIPSADRAFVIADALGVDARWLVTGHGEPRQEPSNQWVQLPYRSLAGGETREWAPVCREWLRRAFGRVEGLWLTEMPSESFPDIAREGDPIVCTGAEKLVEGGIYLIELDMGVVVRRLTTGASGFGFAMDQGFTEGGDRSFVYGGEGVRPLGRIVGTLVKAL